MFGSKPVLGKSPPIQTERNKPNRRPPLVLQPVSHSHIVQDSRWEVFLLLMGGIPLLFRDKKVLVGNEVRTILARSRSMGTRSPIELERFQKTKGFWSREIFSSGSAYFGLNLEIKRGTVRYQCVWFLWFGNFSLNEMKIFFSDSGREIFSHVQKISISSFPNILETPAPLLQ